MGTGRTRNGSICTKGDLPGLVMAIGNKNKKTGQQCCKGNRNVHITYMSRILEDGDFPVCAAHRHLASRLVQRDVEPLEWLLHCEGRASHHRVGDEMTTLLLLLSCVCSTRVLVVVKNLTGKALAGPPPPLPDVVVVEVVVDPDCFAGWVDCDVCAAVDDDGRGERLGGPRWEVRHVTRGNGGRWGETEVGSEDVVVQDVVWPTARGCEPDKRSDGREGWCCCW